MKSQHKSFELINRIKDYFIHIRYIKYGYEYNKPLSITLIILSFLIYLIPAAKLIITADFIDSVINYFSNSKPYKQIMYYLIVLLSIYGIEFLLNIINEIVGAKFYAGLNYYYQEKMTFKISKLKYEVLESEEDCELIDRIKEDINVAF